MTQIRLEFDERELKGIFGDELKKQMKFATAQTLTNAAFDARRAAQMMVRRRLEIKRTFIPNSIVVVKATKNNPEAIVGFLERARLVELLEEGGTRTPFRSRYIAIPVNAKTKSGRITKARRPEALIAKGAFTATINGTHGIWMQVGRGGKKKLKLMYNLEDRTKYTSNTIRFMRTVEGTVPQSFKRNFPRNLSRALRNRRR